MISCYVVLHCVIYIEGDTIYETENLELFALVQPAYIHSSRFGPYKSRTTTISKLDRLSVSFPGDKRHLNNSWDSTVEGALIPGRRATTFLIVKGTEHPGLIESLKTAIEGLRSFDPNIDIRFSRSYGGDL